MISIEDYFQFNKGDRIVIGCSSGPDSMALFDMLLKVREKYNLELICAHVNHNLRKQSVEEAEFMKKYCAEHDVMFEGMLIEKYGDDNFHNEARNIRYHFFESLVEKYHANYLMTAHHGDDLIETVLMRMIRGSNLNGYSGFHEIVDMGSYKIARPLIHYTKKELEDYDKLNNVFYYVDESNHKMKYTRNRYRKYVLPFLKEEDPNVHKKVLKYSHNLAEASKYIEKERDKAYRKIVDPKTGYIKISAFSEFDPYIQKEILYYIMEDFYQDDLILVGDKHIDLLNQVLHSRKANMQVNLPNEILAIKSYDYFYLRRETDELTAYEIEFSKYAELPNKHKISLIDDVSDNSNFICRLSSDEVSLPLIIRTRKLGDKMEVKGLNGKKKVKDIFIDKKIDIRDRDLWPIVVDSLGRIVWIPGIKKSKFDKSKKENYDIIMKYC